MLRILHTGDLHIGRKYTSYESHISSVYVNARIQALENIISLAEEYSCDYIVVSGDIFENKSVSAKDIKTVCEIFGKSPCTVIVIPGNHDFFAGHDDEMWNRFGKYKHDNTLLFTENRPFKTDDAVFYPCICDARHSDTNRIGWIKNSGVNSDSVNIGIAHGEIDPFRFSFENKYYYMSDRELESCNMDLWLIGHTHEPYPKEEKISGRRIFNAGTHQSTDTSKNIEGSVFIIDIDENKNISAQRVKCGVICFAREYCEIKRGQSLKAELDKLTEKFDAEKSSIKLIISGIANSDEYSERDDIYRDIKNKFIYAEIYDNDLQPEITAEMIDSRTIEGSVENRLLKLYTDKPDMLHLAYQLILECREG